MRLAQIRVSRTVTIQTGETLKYDDFTIPQKYLPHNWISKPVGRTVPQIMHFVTSEGVVGVWNNYSQTLTNYALDFVHEWHY